MKLRSNICGDDEAAGDETIQRLDAEIFFAKE
jgi:hypothetical protein